MTARRLPTSRQFFKRLRWIDGLPLWDRIEPYRRRIFAEALDTRDDRGHPRYNFVLTGRAKKNWKTADLILAAIYRLLAWDSPGGNQCYLLANDEGQAGDDLDLAVKIILANPALQAACTIRTKEIVRKDGRGSLLILPAQDTKGSHGKTYVFCGFDEIHEYRDWALLEAMQLDPTRPDAMIWITSYASLHHRPGVPLYDLFQRGKAGGDPRMFFSWYAADFSTDPALADATPEDRANPSRSSWEETDYLDQQRRRLPAVRFRRLHLNLPGYPDGGAFDAVKLDAAVVRGVRVRPPEPGLHYHAFVDMSGGSSDSATLAVGYRDGTRRIVVGAWDQGKRPPFNPHDAIVRFVGILKQYGISAVSADTYGRKAPTLNFEAAFQQAGIAYRPCELGKPALYEAFEPVLNGGEIILPDIPELLEQFAGLQNRGGRIEHRSGEHDDLANAVAGLCWLLGRAAFEFRPGMIQVGGMRASVGGGWGYGNPGRGKPKDWSVADDLQHSADAGGAHAGGRRTSADGPWTL